MKKFISTFFLIVLMSMVGINVFAIEVDGICYDIKAEDMSASVISNPKKYAGDIIIPISIVYESKKYIVTSISQGAFSNCSKLSSVSIPDSVKTIYNDAFKGCPELKIVNISSIEAWCNISFYNDYSNPLKCAHHVYLNGEEIKDLVIPSTVKYINDKAFFYCSGLSSVSIPQSVKSIGDRAFAACENLISVSIQEGMTYMGVQCFEDCKRLKSINIPNSVESIDDYSFRNCICLGSILLPNSIKKIDTGAFANCTSLASISIPDSIEKIYPSTFQGCKSLKSISIPYDVNICKNAFYQCIGLTSVVFPKYITEIEESAFEGCSGLTSITIPGVYYIRKNAFKDCKNLGYVSLSISEMENDAFVGCSNITSLDINCVGVGRGFGSSYGKLQTLRLGSRVKSVWSDAFSGFSALKTISIGENIESIKSQAFANCSKLENVYCYAIKYPTTASNAFKGSYVDYVTLHVPEKSINQYKAHEVWGKFMEIVPIDESTGIAKIEDENVKVQVKNGQIMVNGAEGKKVRLYSVGGSLISTNPDMDGSFSVPAGAYIVKVDDKVVKIVLSK